MIFTDPYSGTGGDTHFAKEPYKRDEILQKSPTIVRRLLIVATPYQHIFAISIFIFRYWRGHTFFLKLILIYTHISLLLNLIFLYPYSGTGRDTHISVQVDIDTHISLLLNFKFIDPYSGTGGDTHIKYVLQKSPTISRRLIVATPYQHTFAISIFTFRYGRGHTFLFKLILTHTSLCS